MNKFYNYVNRQLCEYQSIFPDTVRLLDHLLFTIGTGLKVVSTKGMIYDESKRKFIDDFPEMDAASWDQLITECHQKERKFAEQYARRHPVNEVELAEDCAKYKQVSVDESMFSAEYFYNTMRESSQAKTQKSLTSFMQESFVRPYPLSSTYSNIFKLNEKTPKWFLEIAFNYCKAWEKFLTEEIEQNHVWIKPSLRPKSPDHESKAAVVAELFKMLKSDPTYDGWLDKTEEPESDYADLKYTTTHRDVIAKQAERLAKLLETKNGT